MASSTIKSTYGEASSEDISSKFTGLTSGTVTLLRQGKFRQLMFDVAVLQSDAVFPTLDSKDRPTITSFGVLSITNTNEAGRIWIRANGTFGTSSVLGKSVMGSLIWMIP